MMLFFFNDPATPEIYTLSLHDALPISQVEVLADRLLEEDPPRDRLVEHLGERELGLHHRELRSEEHTSELQSHSDLVCRLLLEKKKNKYKQSLNVHNEET